jgi:hypothetical protein
MSELLCYLISRESVESQNTAPFLEFARPLSRNPRPDQCGNLAIFIDGYNDDHRNLYEIPEVRTFIQTIDAAWPYIGYFGTTLDGADTLQLFGFCNTDIQAWTNLSYPKSGVLFNIPVFMKEWIIPRMCIMNHLAEDAYGEEVFDEEGNETHLYAQRETLIYERTFEVFKAFQLEVEESPISTTNHRNQNQ